MSDDIISGWNIISTNSSDIVMDSVTRDDIISIIAEIKKISGVDKLADILQTFDAHIKLYNKVDPLDYRYDLATGVNNLLITTIKDGESIPSVNPHNTRLKYLVGNILDKLYAMWLLRGNSESIDAFKDLIYKYQKYGTLLDIFNHTSDEVLISVKEFADYFNIFHNDLLDVFDNDVFVISQKNTQWSGEIHGMELVTDPNDNDRKIIVKTDPYIENIWYLCHVDISPRFESAKVHLEIDTDEEMKIEYRLKNQSAWVELTDYVLVDIYKQMSPSGEIINILDPTSYRYNLPTELEHLFVSKLKGGENLNVTVDFRVSPKYKSDRLFSIHDIAIIVDGDGKISDDIYKKEFYADAPHSVILAKFFNHGIAKFPSATCILNKVITTTKPFIMKAFSGSLCCRYQPYISTKKVLPAGTTIPVTKTYKNTVLKIVDSSNNTVLEILVYVTGSLINDNVYADITDVNFTVLNKNNEEYALFNGGKYLLRNMYNFVINYVSFNSIKVYYQSNTEEFEMRNIDLTTFIPTDTEVSVNISNSDITTGVHEFIYYPSLLSDECIKMFILNDNSHWPYL